jgi:hypothetical protein
VLVAILQSTGCCVAFEDLLDFLVNVWIDDGIVLSLVDLRLVAHLAEVNGTGE